VVANRSMLAALLRPLGFEILEANNGQAALDQVQVAPPDLVLMDVVMPVMDGLEATRRIRQNPAHQQLPIITISANASDADRTQCMAVGASGFLAKPFGRADLLEQIRTCLGLRWVVDTSEAEA